MTKTGVIYTDHGKWYLRAQWTNDAAVVFDSPYFDKTEPWRVANWAWRTYGVIVKRWAPTFIDAKDNPQDHTDIW